MKSGTAHCVLGFTSMWEETDLPSVACVLGMDIFEKMLRLSPPVPTVVS